MVLESPVFLAVYAISVFWLGSNLLSMSLWGHFFLTPGFGTGRSMEPALPGGLTVYIEYYPRHIQEGDIVSYEHPNREVAVCHRVIETDGDLIRIKGDNNEWDDGWFHRRVVLGKIWSPRGNPLYLPLSPFAIRQSINNRREQ